VLGLLLLLVFIRLRLDSLVTLRIQLLAFELLLAYGIGLELLLSSINACVFRMDLEGAFPLEEVGRDAEVAPASRVAGSVATRELGNPQYHSIEVFLHLLLDPQALDDNVGSWRAMDEGYGLFSLEVGQLARSLSVILQIDQVPYVLFIFILHFLDLHHRVRLRLSFFLVKDLVLPLFELTFDLFFLYFLLQLFDLVTVLDFEELFVDIVER